MDIMKLPFMIDLTGKTAVVTGGGGVLCSAFAKAIAQTGAAVAVLDLNEDAAKSVAAQINEDGGKAIGIAANVLEKESLEKAKKIINDAFGTVDIFLNGAGGNNPRGTTSKDYFDPSDEAIEGVKTFFDLDPSGIEFVFNLNFLGTLLPTQVFAHDLLGKKDASIINISSMWGQVGASCESLYSITKAGIDAMTKSLAKELGPSGIRVNSIAPGFIDTDMNKCYS